jgi:hypothetical protein
MALYNDSYSRLKKFAQTYSTEWIPPEVLGGGEYRLIDPASAEEIEQKGYAIYQAGTGKVIEFITAGSGGWEATLWAKDPGDEYEGNEAHAIANDAELQGLYDAVLAALGMEAEPPTSQYDPPGADEEVQLLDHSQLVESNQPPDRDWE